MLAFTPREIQSTPDLGTSVDANDSRGSRSRSSFEADSTEHAPASDQCSAIARNDDRIPEPREPVMTIETANDTKLGTSFVQDANQFLTFSLGHETYGIELLRVQEIRGYSPATPIPNAPPWVRGVMNLRGTIVPVVDLRSKLGLESAEYNRFTVIIVVNVGTRVTGLIVDSVSDVLTFTAKEIQPTPDLGTSADGRFARGIARFQDSLVVLIDLERVLGGVDMASAEPLGAAA